MGTEPLERKLAAILYADVAGYSRLTGEDEEGTHRRLSAYLDAITASIEKHNGTVLHFAGDAILADFATVSDALICAAAVQQDLKERNKDLPEDRKVQFRIGVNLGEVIVDRGEIYGDGVNVAARLESLAEPAGICISESVRTAISNKLPLDYEFTGEQQVKNIAEPVRAYSATLKPDAVLPAPSARPKTRRPIRYPIATTAAAVVLIIGVITWLAPWAPTIEPASEEQMAFPLPEQPSIAVLPFDNLSADPTQEAIADGFTESLITTLAQMPELFVIARNSSFTYKGKPVKVKQVAEELGVRYVLEGSIQREGDTLRIAAQLIDAVKGHHLWADSYDRDANALFAVQDEIIRQIFTALRVKLVEGEHGRVHQQGTENFAAFLKWLEGWRHFRRSTKDDNAVARQLILEAIDMDPDWAMPYTTVTWTHWKDIFHGWRATPDESLKLAEEYAKKALALDDTYPGVYASLGAVQGIKGNLDQAIAYQEKAVALGPNISVYQAILADNLNLAGRAEEAVALLKKAMRLEPTYQDWYIASLGNAYTSLGRHEEAIETFNQLLKRRPGSASGHVGLIVNHMWLDRQDEARGYASKLLESKPKFTLSSYRKRLKYKDAAYVERLLDTLRTAGLPENPTLALPDKPSIAVLPFTNMSDDPRQEYFVDGMTEDLITDLSKISSLFVIARNSTFAYKGKSSDVRQVARELGVKYVLEGSVRRADAQVRINAQLIDATTGGHLWAERYDGSLADVFALQDKVTRQIVTALAVNLTADEDARQGHKQTDNPEAYDAFLQGWAHYRQYTRKDFAKALDYFERAVELDPNYARAHAAIAGTYTFATVRGWHFNLRWCHSQFLAERHLQLAVKNPTVLTHRIAAALRSQQGRHEEALAEAEQMIALDPNDAENYDALGYVLIWAGKPEEAIDAYKKAMRLDPHYPAQYLERLGLAYFSTGQFEAAVESLARARKRNPGLAAWTLAAAYGHLGREEEAAATLEQYREYRGWSKLGFVDAVVGYHPYKRREDAERLGAGLIKAGLCCQDKLDNYLAAVPGGNWNFTRTVEMAKSFEQPAGVTVLTEAEIHDKVVGNTIAREPDKKKNKKKWSQYYLTDGTFLEIWGGQRYCGYWVVSGPVMCTGYSDGNDSCRMYALEGTTITRFKLDGTLGSTGKLLQGNPENL